MIVKEERYYCDYCKKEMSFDEYHKRAKLTLVLQLANPEYGRDSDKGVVDMEICPKCCDEIGIKNTEEHHKFVYSQSRIKNMLDYCKDKVINLFKHKIMMDNNQ
ncbi:hypothetical protein H8S20_01535 [Clostridium sp. NSJ-6]|uniref:HNH endonuclease n=1 Tax=Clostridium hominis TaxID=2763036 RepID=A0ABR7D862_9CLOT|nr:hypothetical protein [Clostridium hominis]MBC5627569.1 hypothetical protein [Clostridium hominis]